MTDTTAKYLIVNRNPEPLTVIVEPWAEEVVLSSGSRLLLTALCDREGLLEVDTDPNYLTAGLGQACCEWREPNDAIASDPISLMGCPAR